MSQPRPKARICRKFGTNIFGADKYDRILQKKPSTPGKGPRARMGRKSEYAQQLMEKQKMRLMYNVSEKQFRRIYEEAISMKGAVAGDAMKALLERRLDNALFRAGFAVTRLQARQFATHGMFSVNGRRVTVPSFRLKIGDVVTARARSKTSPVFSSILAAHEKYLPPGWLKVDARSLRFDVTGLPEPDMAEQAVDIQQVIEFYSRN